MRDTHEYVMPNDINILKSLVDAIMYHRYVSNILSNWL